MDSCADRQGGEQSWELSLLTLTGRRSVVLTLAEDHGRLVGRLAGEGELMPMLDLVREGDRLRWWHRTTRPTRINSRVEVVVSGDHMTGTSRGGWSAPSAVTGVRVA